MEILLQTFKPFFLFFAFFITMLAIKPIASVAQTAGDVAFIGFNANEEDDFALVVLADIPANTKIFFTDKEWDGTAFGAGEDDIVWDTGNSVTLAGTVVVFDGINTNDSITVTSGSISEGSMNLETANEVLFAYISKDGSRRNVDTFLGAISNSVEQYDGTDGTLKGTGLIQGDQAILLNPDNVDAGQYTGDRSGNTPSEYRSLLNDIANNWAVNEDKSNITLPFDNQPFVIVNPGELNLAITQDEMPPVAINEILYDPTGAGDANGDGLTDSNDDEFIEFVNTSDKKLDISNWTISDADNIRYTFKSGTVIPGGSAFVVFSKAAEGSGFGTSYLFAAGSSLSLNDGGDTVTLADAGGNIIATYTYSGSESNESITRNPDITGNFEGHTTADSGEDSSPFSPGTKIGGTAFSSTYAIGLRGNEGYRFVATPTSGTSFDDLFSNLWTQGATSSDASSATPNIYSWDEASGGRFSPVTTDLNTTNLTPGQGYIIYVFEDDDYRKPGLQGGFPKMINTDNAENVSPISLEVSSQDGNSNSTYDSATNEGYNLLGNPYGTSISAVAMIDALEAVNPNMNTNLLVWDHEAGGGNGQYISLDGSEGSSDVIAPFQAFFIRYTTLFSGANASFDRSDLAANGERQYSKSTKTEPIVSFKINMGDGQKFDSYNVEFREKGTIGEDRYDAYKLFSLNANAISFFSTLGEGVKLAKNVLPPLSELDGEGELRVPLKYDIPKSGTYTFSWNNIEDLPNDLELYMLDNQTGKKVNLRSQDQLQINLGKDTEQTEQQVANTKLPYPQLGNTNSEGSTRFELLVTYNTLQQVPEKTPITQPIVISPNYPNPFNAQTTMDVQVREKMRVKMTVYNIVGQQVATMADQIMNPGQEYPMTWNAPLNMPSGIYICKVEAGGMVVTRKMTLVK